MSLSGSVIEAGLVVVIVSWLSVSECKGRKPDYKDKGNFVTEYRIICHKKLKSRFNVFHSIIFPPIFVEFTHI